MSLRDIPPLSNLPPPKVANGMSPRLPRPCPVFGCPLLQPCPAHPRIPWAGSTRRTRLPRNWPAIRTRILRRDGQRCTHTQDGQRCTAPATDVDHIINNDDHRDANLQSLCGPHHDAKSSREGHQARKGHPDG